ncbi:MAG TPA: hypothetical protein VJ600_08460 [Holophagaceae bacterium]|nr:hypothetical protein [Holophagaceae bacterium]
MDSPLQTVLVILLIIACIGFFWVFPIALGVSIAKKKNRSPNWMWFGIHPMMGWITVAVLAGLPPLKECPQCAEKVKAHAKVCPYCMTPFHAQVSDGGH